MTGSELPAHVQCRFETPSVYFFFFFLCGFSSLDEVFSISGVPAQQSLEQSLFLPSAHSPYFVLQ